MAAERRFSEADRNAVYRAIYARRDVRSYLPDPLPDALLSRVLDAAHHAPSVGFMQPWNFVVVRDPAQKRAVHAHFLEVNARAAEVYGDDDRKRAYRALKLQGILDAPVNVLVTCDRERGGPHVLGRFTTPDTDVYSTCLAIQNLWLAARAEGVGVGWMSLMDHRAVAELLGVPEHVLPVAYLTLGYPVELREAPMLADVGWRARLPLADLVFDEAWARPAPWLEPASDPRAPRGALARDHAVPEDAAQRNRDLLKPEGSLGELERAALQLAALQRSAYPRADAAALLLFAGDHGVTEEGVSHYRRDTTLKMVYAYLAGGAVVNALARREQLPVHVVDVGVDHDFGAAEGLIQRKIARGTHNFTRTAAMSAAECASAIEVGREAVRALPELEVLVLGEMGIGNSTSAAALSAALLGRDAATMTGAGTGVSGERLRHKQAVVERALALHAAPDVGPLSLLARLGGFEIAAMVGAMLEAAHRSALVLLDGFIVGAAALVAARLEPAVLPCLRAAHVGAEPGHAYVLAELGLTPLLSLGLRLGEGSGAVLALGLLRGACAVMREVRTFEEANIARPERDGPSSAEGA
jgi:nicotinate-nucleotide--dimethylbenzimidazole phosphoribosyltransferase